jgi:hypothetical protein
VTVAGVKLKSTGKFNGGCKATELGRMAGRVVRMKNRKSEGRPNSTEPCG